MNLILFTNVGYEISVQLFRETAWMYLRHW